MARFLLFPLLCVLVACRCASAFWLWDLFTGKSAAAGKDEVATPAAASSTSSDPKGSTTSSTTSFKTTSAASSKKDEDGAAPASADEAGSSTGKKQLIPPPRPGKLPATSSKFFSKAPPKTFGPPDRRPDNASVVPSRHQFDNYLMRKVMENIERLGSMSKLLILGDALFYKLSKTKERWQPLEQRYAAINLGAPGDRTENILKRFEDGQHLLNITSEGPTMLLQVGASNALLRDSPSAIMAGIDAVLSLLRTHLKKPRFILLSLLPRGFPGAPVNETIREVNTLLSAEYGLKRHEDVEYANVAKLFLHKGGYKDASSVNLEYFNADKINLNNAGLDTLMGFVEALLKMPPLKNVPMAKSSSTSNKLLISPLVNVDKKKVPVQDEQTAAEEVAAPPKTRARGKERPTLSLTTSTASRGSGASMGARERSVTTASSLMRARSIPVDRPGSDAGDGDRPTGRTGKRAASSEEESSSSSAAPGMEDPPKESRVRGGSKKMKMPSPRSKESRGEETRV